MSTSDDGISRDDPRLNEILAEYLQAIEVGHPIDQQRFLQDHPEYAHELQQFFADKKSIDRIAAPGIANDLPASDQPANPIDMPTLPPDTSADESATLGPLGPTVGREVASQSASPKSGVPAPGTLVRYFGDYELLDEIARGGMGVVYKARQVKLNRVVALKMILAGQLASKEDVQRFYTEAEAAAGLDHPGIVPIFEVGEHAGQHYFSMGFVDGQSLSAKLADKPLAPREAGELLHHVALAVQYAHEKGVIHRDLKPANILLKGSRESAIPSQGNASGTAFRSQHPMVTDFGLAKKTTGDSNLTGSGQILGTPSYMPPEQAAGRLDDVRETADVYSLGAILYACLTGRAPFQAANPLDTLLQVLEQEPVAPRVLNSSVPQDLETICLKCLEKDRGRRYATARELADELERFLDGRPIHARPITRLERAAKWARRHPTTTALSAAVAASLLIGFIAVAWQWRAAVAARGEAERSLIRSLLEQARTVRLARQGGNRWQSLALLAKAETLRRRHQSSENADANYLAGAELAIQTTTRAELRTEALAVLQSPDGRVREQWKSFRHSISPDGSFACATVPKSIRRLSTTLIDLRRGEEVRNWEEDAVESGLAHGLAPGGTVLAVLSERGVEIRDLLHGKPSRLLPRPTDLPAGENVTAEAVDGFVLLENQRLEFSPNGRYLAGFMRSYFKTGGREVTRSSAPKLVIWDLGRDGASRILTEAQKATEGNLWLCFCPDGSRLAYVSAPQQITIWNIERAEVEIELQLPRKALGPLRFSSDGKLLAWIGQSDLVDVAIVSLWNLETGRERGIIPTRRMTSDSCLAFSPDSTRIATGTSNGAITVFRADTLSEEFRLDHEGDTVRTLDWSQDGQSLVSGALASIKQWEIESAIPTSILPLELPQGSAIRRFKIHPDGRSIVVTSNDQPHYKIYEIPSGVLKSTIESNSKSSIGSYMRFTSDGKRLMLSSHDGVDIYDWGRDQSITRLHHDIRGSFVSSLNSVFGPDGSPLVARTERGKIRISNLTTNTTVWEGSSPANGKTQIIQVSQDGRLVAQWSFDTTKFFTSDHEVRELATQRLILKLSASQIVDRVEFSPRGKWLAAICRPPGLNFLRDPDKILDIRETLGRSTVRLWDLKTGKVLADIQGPVMSIAFSADDKLFAIGCAGQGIEIWNVEHNQKLLQWSVDLPNDTIQHMEFTPDGRQLAVSTGRDGQIQLLDLAYLCNRLTPIGLGWE